MWEPVQIKLTDFVSHKESLYDFQKGETVMIYGRNIDDGDSNGSGKSALVKAITLCLVDLPDKILNKEDYIRDGADLCDIQMYLENKVTKTTLRIVRRIFNNTRSSELDVYENDVLNTEITSVREGNARILELLDISKEDLLNYFIINQENSHSFFRATDDSKKKIISRFTNSVLIDQVLEKINEDYDEISAKIEKFEGKITQSETLLENYEEQIEFEITGREEETKELYNRYIDELAQLKEELKELRGEKVSKKQELDDFEEELEGLEFVDVSELEKKQEVRKEKIQSIEEATKETKKVKGKLDTKIAGEIECPKCSHAWSTAALEDDLDELKGLHKACEEVLVEYEKRVEKVQRFIDKFRREISNQKETNDSIGRYDKKINATKQDLSGYKDKLAKKKEAIEKLEEKTLEFVNFMKDTDRIKELKDTAKKTDESISIYGKTVERLGRKLEEVDFWRINFGMSGFKTYLVNKVLLSLEGYVNYHLKKFNTNMMVKINGFRVLKSGEVRENIEVLVTKDTKNWKKFQRFSGGQKERVNVCGILTIQKLINMTSKAGGLNLLVLDEFFEGLDNKGQTGVLSILEQTDVTNLVISHNNNDIGASNELWVRYENGVSELIEDNKEILELKI